ncbi:hypothetical protein BDR03DRAFT_950145 [Suillus americanus]|nr:hypothetical protein BDR03DRAFT_950145 [Suillus americanus]
MSTFHRLIEKRQTCLTIRRSRNTKPLMKLHRDSIVFGVILNKYSLRLHPRTGT